MGWVTFARSLAPKTGHFYFIEIRRFLGKAQLGTEEIHVEEIVRSVGTEIPDDHFLDGKYRWPYGLPMIAAERFPKQPDLAEVVGNYLPGMEWASYALDIGQKLGPEILQRVESLEGVPVEIVEAPAIVRQRERQRALELNRASGKTGPAPSTSRSGSERAQHTAHAYLFQLRGTERSVFKVGYAIDVEGRRQSLNKGLVSRITGCSWVHVLTQEFSTEQQAYDFEQLVHERLRDDRIEGEQEIYEANRQQLQSTWVDVFQKAEWTQRAGDKSPDAS